MKLQRARTRYNSNKLRAILPTLLLFLSPNLLAAAASKAADSVLALRSINATSCKLKDGYWNVGWTPLKPPTQSELVQFEFNDRSGRIVGREIELLDASSNARGLLTKSLLPPSISSGAYQVECTIAEVDDPVYLRLSGASCSITHDVFHVDIGLVERLRRVAIFDNRILLMVTVDGLVGPGMVGESLLDGSSTFVRERGRGAQTDLVLHGFGPQTIQIGLSNLDRGSNDVIYGLISGGEQTPLGHICFNL